MAGTKPHSTDVMLLIGQLLAAAQAASDGLKSNSAEIQSNGKAIIAAVRTLELIEETVGELDRLIRTGNGDSLLTRFAVLKAEVTELHTQMTELSDLVQMTVGQIQTIHGDHRGAAGGRKVVIEILKAVGWVLTTAIAVYAAVKGSQ